MTALMVARAVIEVLRTSSNPAFQQLEFPQYLRELHAQEQADGTTTVEIDKRHYRRYKARSKRRYPPPLVNPAEIKAAFKAELASKDFYVVEARDSGAEYIILSIRSIENES